MWFFGRVRERARPHLSDEHFTVDGTLIDPWASQGSFRPKDGGPGDGRDFRRQRRRIATHQSISLPWGRLYSKVRRQEAPSTYAGHVLAENRQGLMVDAMATQADARVEADAVLLLAHRRRQHHADKMSESSSPIGAR